VYAAAERRQQTHPPVTQFVEAAFDHDRAVVRNGTRRCLVVEVTQQVLGRPCIEVVIAHEPLDRGRPREPAQIANQLADGIAKLDGTALAVAVPERHLPWLPRRGRHKDPVVGDFLDAPRGGAERKGFAHLALEHHFLVELTDAHRPIGSSEEDAVESTVRNGAGVGDRHTFGAFPGCDHPVHPVPGDAWAKLRELVRRVTA